VLQVLLGAAAGSGALDIYFGGATANTIAAPNFGDPFAFSAPGAAAIQPPAATAATPFGGGPASVPAVLGSSESAAPGANPAVQPQAAVLAGSTKCETTSPAGSGGCWSGLGALAGGAAVVLGGLLLYADMRKSRRIRAPEPDGADA
jgi:hypothetical protein